MCFSRQVVANRIKQKQARENGNTNLLFALIIIGSLLMAGHVLFSHLHHFHHSMRDMLKSLVNRNAVKQAGREVVHGVQDTLASDEGREIIPHILPENDRER